MSEGCSRQRRLWEVLQCISILVPKVPFVAKLTSGQAARTSVVVVLHLHLCNLSLKLLCYLPTQFSVDSRQWLRVLAPHPSLMTGLPPSHYGLIRRQEGPPTARTRHPYPKRRSSGCQSHQRSGCSVIYGRGPQRPASPTSPVSRTDPTSPSLAARWRFAGTLSGRGRALSLSLQRAGVVGECLCGVFVRLPPERRLLACHPAESLGGLLQLSRRRLVWWDAQSLGGRHSTDPACEKKTSVPPLPITFLRNGQRAAREGMWGSVRPVK